MSRLYCYHAEVTAVSPYMYRGHCSITLHVQRSLSLQYHPHLQQVKISSQPAPPPLKSVGRWQQAYLQSQVLTLLQHCSTAEWGDTTSSCSPPPWRPCCSTCAGRGSHRSARSSTQITARAANEPSEKFSQSWRRPLLGPSPECKRLLALSHLRIL